MKKYRVVFHLDEGGKGRVDMTLNNIDNLITELGEENVDVELVSNSEGVTAFLKRDLEIVCNTPASGTLLLLMSGEPINEPIVGHGPFVMNCKTEILEAFNDFNGGAFGQIERD